MENLNLKIFINYYSVPRKFLNPKFSIDGTSDEISESLISIQLTCLAIYIFSGRDFLISKT